MCSAGSCFIYNFIIINYYYCYYYYYFSPPRAHRSPGAAVPQRRGPLFSRGGAAPHPPGAAGEASPCLPPGAQGPCREGEHGGKHELGLGLMPSPPWPEVFRRDACLA